MSGYFLETVREALGFVPELSAKRMFGGVGLFCGPAMFAILMDDVLYLKADGETVAQFEAEGLAPFSYFDRRAGVERGLGYRQAPEAVFEDDEAARAWARLALEAAFRARTSKNTKNHKTPRR